MSTSAQAEPTAEGKNPLAVHSDNIAQLSEILRNSQTTFFALILACVYSFLAIATTTDAALLSNSSATPLPIIQVNVPIVWFYYFAPIILAVLFIYFHLYLERFWRCVTRLPLRHPDGRGLDDYVYPWLISSAFIRGEILELSKNRISARLEAWLSLLLAWWLIPVVLLFYWGRYLAAHDWFGTLLHIALILITASIAYRFFYTAKNALQMMAARAADRTGGDGQTGRSSPNPERKQSVLYGVGLLLLGTALLYLSASAIQGLSDEICTNVRPDHGCGFYNPGRKVWETIGVAPYSEVKEERFIAKPENWEILLRDRIALQNFLDTQRALVLTGRDMRSISAGQAFLPGSRINTSILDYADLQHAVITGSRLEDVILRGADLTDADLQYARIINTQFEDVFALATRFDHTSFTDATSEQRTRLSGDFSGASFDNASGDKLLFYAGENIQSETSLRETNLRGAEFTWSDFENVDLSGARMDDATLTHNTFVNADFSRAIISNAMLNLSTFTRCRFISPAIRDSFFEEAKFIDSEFDHTPLRAAASGNVLRNAPRKVSERFQGFGAIFSGGSRIRNVQFAEADLRFAKFESVEFANTLFSDSDLSGASFEDIDLSGLEFENVDLSGANLEHARNVRPHLLAGACGNADTRLPAEMEIKPCREG